MKIAIKTLGCKSNRFESDSIFEALKNDYEVYEVNEGASTFAKNAQGQTDLLIVNSCTVTHVADRKSRQAIRSFKRLNPDSRVAVFGCSSNIHPEQYEEMEEVDFRAENSKDIIKYACELAEVIQKEQSCNFQFDESSHGMRTRGLVKIQDGCNNFCSYCIIPFARGPEVSFDKDEILAQVRKKAEQGFKEIVLTGIIISEWKQDGWDIADLINFLIQNVNNVRFRLSSIEPNNFSDQFFDLLKTQGLCPHMHMSLQSGSDSVLKRMRRNYDTEFFLKVAEKFRESCPEISLTTDVIVGFPGETDAEFSETLDFVKKIKFSRIHVFPYSKRRNTAAFHMKNQVDDVVKKERAKVLRDLSDEFERDFWRANLGRVESVLVEEIVEGFCVGRSANYIPVRFKGREDEDCVGETVEVELLEIMNNKFVRGELCK